MDYRGFERAFVGEQWSVCESFNLKTWTVQQTLEYEKELQSASDTHCTHSAMSGGKDNEEQEQVSDPLSRYPKGSEQNPRFMGYGEDRAA